MLYKILALIIEVGVRQFFQRVTISGAPLAGDGAVIVAANHPNQAVDSFLIGSLYNRPVSFLAKSTLFVNPILNAFFRALYMVPVYRARDQSDTSLNEEMFSAVVERLHADQVIAIFPEGTSSEERRLLPLKTGVARIALQAEAKKAWTAKVKIQPIGITYLSPRLFQSSVAMVIGEPINVCDYRAAYEQDPKQAVKALTADVEERLRLVTVSIPNIELQEDVERITQLFDDQPDMRERMQFIADEATKLSSALPAETVMIRREMDELSRAGFELGFFGIGSQALVTQSITTLQLVSMLVGRILHFVPYYATQFAVQFSVKDLHNLASVKIGYGILFYSAWYLALFVTLISLGVSGLVSCAVLVLIMVLGDRTNRYTDGAMIYLRRKISTLLNSTNSEQAYHQRLERFLAQRAALRERLISTSQAYQGGER